LHTGGEMAYRYFIKLAYNGLDYAGWQIQPNADTVQQWIENSLALIAGVRGGVTGCGRTDTGVHASEYYAHFDCEKAYDAEERDQLVLRLNRFLPQDIVVHKVVPVALGAHARFSAEWREYEYIVIREKDPFRYRQAYLVHGNLDTKLMRKAADLLLGKHDFQCFSKVNTQVNTYFCNIYSVDIKQKDHFLIFSIRADRFLRNMVRAIVGTLLDVGRGKISTAEFQKIIESRNRSEAGLSVPARGLTLIGIGYPENIFKNEPLYFLPESRKEVICHHDTDPEFHQGTGNEPNK